MKRKTAIKKLMGMGYSRNRAAELLDDKHSVGWTNSNVVYLETISRDKWLRDFMVKEFKACSYELVHQIGVVADIFVSSVRNIFAGIFDDHDISGLLEDE